MYLFSYVDENHSENGLDDSDKMKQALRTFILKMMTTNSKNPSTQILSEKTFIKN